MHVLREVVRELAPAVRERVRGGCAGEGRARDDGQVREQCGGERGDQRGGGAEPGLVHVGEADVRGAEGREFGEGGEGWGEVAEGELELGFRKGVLRRDWMNVPERAGSRSRCRQR